MFFYSAITQMDKDYLSACLKRLFIVDKLATRGPGGHQNLYVHENDYILKCASGEEADYKLHLFMMDLELGRGISHEFSPEDPQYFRWGEMKLALIEVVGYLEDRMFDSGVPDVTVNYSRFLS